MGVHVHVHVCGNKPLIEPFQLHPSHLSEGGVDTVVKYWLIQQLVALMLCVCVHRVIEDSR